MTPRPARTGGGIVLSPNGVPSAPQPEHKRQVLGPDGRPRSPARAPRSERCRVAVHQVIDGESGIHLAELYPAQSIGTWTSGPARRVATVAKPGATERVMLDNAGEFRPAAFEKAVERRALDTTCPRRPTADQRLPGVGPGDDPRRVLEAVLRSLPNPQVQRAPVRPRSLLPLMQENRSGALRPSDEGRTPEAVVGKGDRCGRARNRCVATTRDRTS
jgi:hypothetical protein